MSILSEFKDFAVKGNVVDMAVGIVIGAGFGNIISSFVKDIIMPPVGVLLGGVDFSELSLIIQQAGNGLPAVSIRYGIFLQTVIDFIIIAFAIFMVVKMMNRITRQKQIPEIHAVKLSNEEKLLTEIRDLLKNNGFGK